MNLKTIILASALLVSSTLARRRPTEIYISHDHDESMLPETLLRKDLMDLAPPVSGWPSVALNAENEAELRVHIEKYSNLFRYLSQAEKNVRLEASVFRRGLLAACLASLDAASKMKILLGNREMQYRQDFNDAIRNSLEILNRPAVVRQFLAIFPREVLAQFLNAVFSDIVLSSETISDAQALLDRFMSWLNFWKNEIRNSDTESLRNIIPKNQKIYQRSKRFIQTLIEYRIALTDRNTEKVHFYEKDLIHQLGNSKRTSYSFFGIAVAGLIGLLINLA